MIGTPQQMGAAIQGYGGQQVQGQMSPWQGIGTLADTMTNMMLQNRMAQATGKNSPFPEINGLFGIGGQSPAVTQNPATASALPTV